MGGLAANSTEKGRQTGHSREGEGERKGDIHTRIYVEVER